MRDLLFKERLIRKILKGEKTRTIRKHGRYKVGRVYAVQRKVGERAVAWIRITRKQGPKKLGELTDEDVRPDGYSSLSEFKREWRSLYDGWDPDEVVWLYDFELEGSSAYRSARKRP